MAVWNSQAVRVSVQMESNLRPIVNVFHVDTDIINPPVETLEAICQMFADQWADLFMPDLAGTTDLVAVSAYSMAGPEAPVFNLIVSPQVAGGTAGEALPLQSAAVITWRTAGRGRSARGRSYISGWSEASSNGNALISGAASALQANAVALMNYFAAQEFPLVVYSTQSGGNDRPTAVLFPIIAADVRTPVFGSQRDRNGRE